MQITHVLAQMGGLASMAKELGVTETQAATGAEALIPAILGGFKKQAQAQFAVKEEKMVEEVKKLLAKHSIKH